MSVYKNLYFWEDFILEYLFNLEKLLIKNVGGIVILAITTLMSRLRPSFPGHAVAYTIGPIFKHIIDYVQLYFTNDFTNIVLQCVNCHSLVGVTLIFDGTTQIIVQRCQIAAPRWPNDISSAHLMAT